MTCLQMAEVQEAELLLVHSIKLSVVFSIYFLQSAYS